MRRGQEALCKGVQQRDAAAQQQSCQARARSGKVKAGGPVEERAGGPERRGQQQEAAAQQQSCQARSRSERVRVAARLGSSWSPFLFRIPFE